MAGVKMKRQEVIALIRKYKELDILWNYHHAYHNRLSLRREAWEQLAKKFALTVNEARRKVRNLRNTYRNLRRKVKESAKTGNLCKANLFYYSEFDFLRNISPVRIQTAQYKHSDEDNSLELMEELWLEETDAIINSDDDEHYVSAKSANQSDASRSIKFTRHDIIELIEIYKSYKCLWNSNCPQYKRRDKKLEAWHDIAGRFKCSVEAVKRKMKNLRTTYVVEKNKVDDSKRNSLGDFYQPNLFYYNKFNFLDKAILSKKQVMYMEKDQHNDQTSKNPEKLLEDIDESISSSDVVNQFTPLMKRECKREAQGEENSNFSIESQPRVMESSTFLSKKSRTYATFGEAIALQLKNLSFVNASKAMTRIQEIITEYAIAELKEEENSTNGESNSVHS